MVAIGVKIWSCKTEVYHPDLVEVLVIFVAHEDVVQLQVVVDQPQIVDALKNRDQPYTDLTNSFQRKRLLSFVEIVLHGFPQSFLYNKWGSLIFLFLVLPRLRLNLWYFWELDYKFSTAIYLWKILIWRFIEFCYCLELLGIHFEILGYFDHIITRLVLTILNIVSSIKLSELARRKSLFKYIALQEKKPDVWVQVFFEMMFGFQLRYVACVHFIIIARLSYF